MFGGFLVARLHVEEREIRMDELFLGLELLGFVTLCDGGGKIAFAIKCHAERELRVEMRWLNCKDGVQLGDGIVEFAIAKGEHCIVVLFLKIFGHASR